MCGPAVLASYVYCLVRFPEASSQMWGGVPERVRTLYTAWMFVAAAGYFAYGYLFLFRTDPSQAKLLGGRGYDVLAWLYALVLIPSAIWMPATVWLIDEPSTLRFWLVRLDLFAVAIGSIGLVLASVSLAPRASSRVRGLAIAGAIAFSIQTVLLDALIWPALFELP